MCMTHICWCTNQFSKYCVIIVIHPPIRTSYQARAKPATVTVGSKCHWSMNLHLVEVNGLFMPPITAVLDHWLLGGGLNPMALLMLVK